MIEWILSYGDIGLFFMALSESVFFPIPPDIVQITLSLARPEHSLWLALLCTLGSLIGGVFGYLAGRYGGRPVMLAVSSRQPSETGRKLKKFSLGWIISRLLSEEKIRLVEHYYHKYDVMAIGIAGFTPIPYKVFTITAGMFNIRFTRFVIVSFFSRGARFFAVGTLLYVWGAAMREVILKYFNLFSIFFVVLLLAGFYVVHLMAKKHRIRNVADDEAGT